MTNKHSLIMHSNYCMTPRVQMTLLHGAASVTGAASVAAVAGVTGVAG